MSGVKNNLYETQLKALREEKAMYRQKLHMAESKLKQIDRCLYQYSSDVITLKEMVEGIDKVLNWPDE